MAVICCLLVFLLKGRVRKDVENIGSRGTNIICFGDSFTFGYGVAPEYSYPAALAKMVGIPVINAGIDGDTSSEGLKRIKNDVLDRKPLLVIIEFGGNDFLRQIPFEVTIKNIEEMIKIVQSQGAIVAVADIGTSVVMGNYGREYKRLSREYNVVFIPALLRGIITNPSLKSDFIHPNEEGYKIISHRVYREIIPCLNQNTTIREFSVNKK